MASRPDKQENHIENSRDGEGPRPAPAVQTRQGSLGRPVLVVLLVGLILAMLFWVPVEWWGNAIAPERESNDTRTEQPASPTTPSDANGGTNSGG
ncbi:hypothetical protein [Ciceribacter thiooxidans]|uniref:Uncharacterized protein n=1 Tax=Ciceribacter thiooxidans TaxID=1969821 RepID=A0ABV7I161_9HYPH|nr:hypothetical protein [Ciceribacter thiooxidans]